MRWLGVTVGILAVLALLLAVGIYFRSEMIINQTYAAATDEIAIATDAAILARGEHLANYVSVCVDCHGANLEGVVVVDDPALGRIVAPNLTTGQGGVPQTMFKDTPSSQAEPTDHGARGGTPN